MNTPIRTTVIYAFFSGLVVVPTALLLSFHLLSWSTAIKLALWADIALYGVLMARWSGTRLLSVFFPLAVLLAVALWPRVYDGFFVFALGVFSWLRSGLCFQRTPIRTLTAELTTMVGGAILLLLFHGTTPVAMSLNICLFFLVQSLFYFWVPVRQSDSGIAASTDSFEQAAEQANKILDGV